MTQLKRGEIAINKKSLVLHCQTLHSCLNFLDKIMKEPESNERGRKIAKIANEINFTLHSVEHLMLNIPLNKLGDKCILYKKP